MCPMPASAHSIETTILELLAKRGAAKSICPSEAARALAAEFGMGDIVGVVQQEKQEKAAMSLDRAKKMLGRIPRAYDGRLVPANQQQLDAVELLGRAGIISDEDVA